MPSAAVRPVRTWDRVLTVVLLVVAAVAAVGLGYLGLFVGFVSDPCDATCDFGRITAGVVIGAFGPAVLAVAAIVVAIVRLVRRRIAFWVPLVAVALGFAVVPLAYAVASSGVTVH